MDPFEHSVLYRPNIDHNMILDKKFLKKKKQIFQSSNLKPHRRNKTIQDNYYQRAHNNDQKSKQRLQLPDIYLYSKPKHQQIIEIGQKGKLMKQISKNLSFISKKISIINSDLLELIKEPTRPVSYDSDEYKNQLMLINEIFSECGINLASRDIFTLEGKQSQAKYSLFTNYPKHPQSICCKFPVVIKHMDFVSQKIFKLYYRDRNAERNDCLKSVMTVSCLKCEKDVIKILPSSSNGSVNNQKVKRSDFEEEKRLINFSKLIVSGRFKKHLINDQSIDLLQSRNISILSRSKTSLKKINQISQTFRLHEKQKLKRYQKQKNRVKSQQVSLELRHKNGENNLDKLIKIKGNLNV